MWRAAVRWGGAIALTLAAAYGCSDPAPVIVSPSTAGPGSGGAATGTGVGGQGGGGGALAVGGGPGNVSPVHVGLEPNADALTSPASPAAALAGELTTYAAGVRARVLDVPWHAYDGAALATDVAAARDRGLMVVVSLLFVDRTIDGRPTALQAAAWDDPTTIAALEADLTAIAALLDTDGDALVLGRAVDRYIAAKPSEQAALANFTLAAADHVEGIDDTLTVAVGVAFEGFGGEARPPADLAQLLAIGSAVAMSYAPGLGDATLPADTSIPKDLTTMVDAAAGRPILLQSVSFPSDASLGGSEEGQAQFYESLFAAIEPRRAYFPVVHIARLHDLAETPCETLAASHGKLSDTAWSTHVCSSGLRRVGGQPKAAWSKFLGGAAALASP